MAATPVVPSLPDKNKKKVGRSLRLQLAPIFFPDPRGNLPIPIGT
jgi:hypothetical protein